MGGGNDIFRAGARLGGRLRGRGRRRSKRHRTEETGSLLLGSLLEKEGFVCVTLFPVRDLNPGIGLVFAFLPLETV